MLATNYSISLPHNLLLHTVAPIRAVPLGVPSGGSLYGVSIRSSACGSLW